MEGLRNSECTDWRRLGACASIPADEADKIFFPRGSKKVVEAKGICAMCPVLNKCREFAMQHHVRGIWGGTTQDERDYIRECARPKYVKKGRVANVQFA